MFLVDWLSGGPSMTPEEQLKAWKGILRTERLALETKNRSLDRIEYENRIEVQTYAKLGEMKAARILCGALASVRKARERNLMMQMQLKSMESLLTQQAATAKMLKALQLSASAMKSMQTLIKIPELQETARTLSKEMEKAGFIQELADDALTLGDNDALEREADVEVDSILQELTASIKLPNVHVKNISETSKTRPITAAHNKTSEKEITE